MSRRQDLPVALAERVVAWQRVHGRHTLPWQNTRDPYRVWLSEIMLQQTQVATVLGYYERFLARFPDVLTLAAAPLADVLAAWSGLGYYGRARNLHRCAEVVVREHGGVFPPTSAGLETLPGIGRSTAAAIAAFCFGERVAILDGNVKRVLARVLAFGADLADASSERELWNLAAALLPERDVDRYTQGLMDLGATVCLPRAPLCLVCPAREICAAAATGTQERHPVKSRRLLRKQRDDVWLELRWQGRIWLVERPSRGVWAGLWSLPEFASMDALTEAAAAWPGAPEPLPAFTHVLTHLDWKLRPVRWILPTRTSPGRIASIVTPWPEGRWLSANEALALGLPAPLRRRLASAA